MKKHSKEFATIDRDYLALFFNSIDMICMPRRHFLASVSLILPVATVHWTFIDANRDNQHRTGRQWTTQSPPAPLLSLAIPNTSSQSGGSVGLYYLFHLYVRIYILSLYLFSLMINLFLNYFLCLLSKYSHHIHSHTSSCLDLNIHPSPPHHGLFKALKMYQPERRW